MQNTVLSTSAVLLYFLAGVILGWRLFVQHGNDSRNKLISKASALLIGTAATVFHGFYTQCRVVSDDETLTKARLKLVKAAKLVLARTLHLMGMTAPEKM